MIDIIIPQHRTVALTIRCLKSIAQHTEDCRVILIDDGSPATISMVGIEEALGRVHPDSVFLRRDKNTGFGPVVRFGMSKTEYEFFVLMNNDVVVTPHWLDKLLAGIKTSDKLAIIAPVTDNMTGICGYADAGKLVGYSGEKDLEKFFTSLPLKVVTDTDIIPGFCTLMRRRIVWEELGGYDERFQLAHGDRDLNDRIKAAGYQAGLCLNCFVYHTYAATTKLLPKDVYKERYLADKTLLQKKRKERADAG